MKRGVGIRRSWSRHRFRKPLWWQDVRFQVVAVLVAGILVSGLLFSGILLWQSSDTEHQLHAAQAWMNEGKMAWATQSLEALTEKHPDFFEGWVALGQCYLEANELDKAQQALDTAMAIRSREKEFSLEQEDMKILVGFSEATLLRLQHRYSAAETLLLKLYETYPQQPALKHALWDLYYQWGLWHLKQDPNPRKALFYLQEAQSFVTRFRYDRQMQDAIETATIRQYTLIQAQQASLEQRRHFLQEVLTYHYSHTLLSNLAQLEMEAKHPLQSLAYLQQAYQLMPNRYALHYSQALETALKIYRDQGKTQKAQAIQDTLTQIQSQLKREGNPLPYPLKVTIAQVQAKLLNTQTKEWTPEIILHLENKGQIPIPFIQFKIRLAAGQDVLQTYYEHLATPLLPFHKGSLPHRLSVTEDHRYLLQRIPQAQLQVEVWAAFEEGKEAPWFLMTKTTQPLKIQALKKAPALAKPKTAKQSSSQKQTLPSKTI
ncbi:MAG: tetratricopeptide repeat protein [Vampirovibrio sp.]